MYDVLIVGAGVVGSALAYFLSEYNIKIGVLDKNSDIGEGTSKANSGIAHGGYDALPGSLKAKFNILGIRMMDEISDRLSFPFHKIGSLVLCHSQDDFPALKELYKRGIENGAGGLEIWDREKLLKEEKNLNDNIVAALYCKEAGILDPFLMTLAFAEQAAVNGVDFILNRKVKDIRKDGDHWLIKADKEDEEITEVAGGVSEETFSAKILINAAGLFSDEIHNMVSNKKYKIRPRRGQYKLLDMETKGFCKHVLFDLPTEKGKGVLITPTTPGNILLGPTSEFVDCKDNRDTDGKGLAELSLKWKGMVKNLPEHLTITSFSGLRAHEEGDDFVIGEGASNFYDCLGIESPGLTASPAIGKYLADEIAQKNSFSKNKNFKARRQAPINPKNLSFDRRSTLIKKEPAYGRIICRCEEVSEGEILDAIHRPLGARSLDGLKRRVRTMAGRCQGGFCSPLLLEILSRELSKDPEKIYKNNKKSYLISSKLSDGEVDYAN